MFSTGAGDRDLSPEEQNERRRRSKLSPKLERLSVEEFTDDMLKTMLALSGLEPGRRTAALARLEKTVKTVGRS